MMRPTLFLWVMTLCLSSCYERQEGCLDTLAANYDVTADDACVTSCCTYPELILPLTQVYGDSLFSSSQTYTNALGQAFRILDARFYISQVSLASDTAEYVCHERLVTTAGQGIADDFTIVRYVDERVSVGPFRAYGTFRAIRLLLGLDASILNTSWDNLPESHVLSVKSRLEDTDGTPAVMIIRLALSQGGSEEKIVSLAVSGDNKPTAVVSPVAITTTKGSSIQIPVTLDYRGLLHTVDLSLNEEEMKVALWQNMDGFFLVK